MGPRLKLIQLADLPLRFWFAKEEVAHDEERVAEQTEGNKFILEH